VDEAVVFSEEREGGELLGDLLNVLPVEAIVDPEELEVSHVVACADDVLALQDDPPLLAVLQPLPKPLDAQPVVEGQLF